MKHRRFTRIAVLAVVSALLVAAAPLATTPVRLGFEGGDDWEPAIAAPGRHPGRSCRTPRRARTIRRSSSTQSTGRPSTPRS